VRRPARASTPSAIARPCRSSPRAAAARDGRHARFGPARATAAATSVAVLSSLRSSTTVTSSVPDSAVRSRMPRSGRSRRPRCVPAPPRGCRGIAARRRVREAIGTCVPKLTACDHHPDPRGGSQPSGVPGKREHRDPSFGRATARPALALVLACAARPKHSSANSSPTAIGGPNCSRTYRSRPKCCYSTTCGRFRARSQAASRSLFPRRAARARRLGTRLRRRGEVSVSIEAYLALRLLGVPADDPALVRAQTFILAAAASRIRVSSRRCTWR